MKAVSFLVFVPIVKLGQSWSETNQYCYLVSGGLMSSRLNCTPLVSLFSSQVYLTLILKVCYPW